MAEVGRFPRIKKTLCAMTEMKRWQAFLLVFVVLLGLGWGIAYMERDNAPPRYLKDCAAYCKPRAGVMERRGLNAGPDWRPTSHNVVCVCK